MTTALENVPRLVPARMLNEFTYCPRLFYLEWVQGQFEDNYYTVDGRYQHRRVDTETGSTSVTLSSDRLGIIARIDLLDSDERTAIPVETKRGATPDNPERSWEPDRIQLCAQALLLREAGYECEYGQIFYVESHERVPIHFDEILISATLSRLELLRNTALDDRSPDPLIDSPKCPNCSLVGICLPDELNQISARSKMRPRYLVPRDSAASPLYVTEQGATLGIRAGRVQIALKDKPVESIRLLDVSQVNVYGGVQLTSQLLRHLFTHEIPVCWFSQNGWFQGIAHGLPSKNVDLRRKQVAMSYSADIEAARAMVAGKIRNCRTLLRRNVHEEATKALSAMRDLVAQAEQAPSLQALLGYEGAAARTYFQVFGRMLKQGKRLARFDFNGRNRRPPTDPVNCLLSYLYALLAKELTATAFAVGLDPFIGVYHRPRFGRPALALDLAEEFRPLIADSTAITMINNGEVRPSQFIMRNNGVALTDKGKKNVLGAFERRLAAEVRHPTFGYAVSYRRILEVQTRLLAAYILGEIGEYKAFETR